MPTPAAFVRIAVYVVLYVYALGAFAAAAETWVRIADDVPEGVPTAIVQVDRERLVSLANPERTAKRELAHTPAERLRGFSVLLRQLSTKSYRCVIYVLDLSDAETIAHERRHCAGYAHK